MARGYRNQRRNAIHTEGEDKDSFWISYSDLMSALLLTFALFLMVSILDNQNAMEEKEKAIQKVVGVKANIIQELMKAFKDSDLQAEVDPQTGAIRFAGGVFFDTNSSQVSEAGKENLKKFIPQYVGILLSDQFRNEISQIIIEGHTDTKSGYLYNLKLSQDRALSVTTEIFSESFPNFKYREELKKVITANGRSFSVPVLDSQGRIDANKSRRVEFKFKLKDDELIQQIQGMVK
jgi:outer membrane protein OmpA-like peptidoglycan-associated protein